MKINADYDALSTHVYLIWFYARIFLSFRNVYHSLLPLYFVIHLHSRDRRVWACLCVWLFFAVERKRKQSRFIIPDLKKVHHSTSFSVRRHEVSMNLLLHALLSIRIYVYTIVFILLIFAIHQWNFSRITFIFWVCNSYTGKLHITFNHFADRRAYLKYE